MINPYADTPTALNSSRALAQPTNPRLFSTENSYASIEVDSNKVIEQRNLEHPPLSDEIRGRDFHDGRGSEKKPQTSHEDAVKSRDDVLFDENVWVQVKALDREEVRQPIGVCVMYGRQSLSKHSTSMINSNSRAITVRLTDPRDPFFLYSMVLGEDEYGKFKEVNELHVDFNGFPQDLITMLRCGDGLGAQEGSSPTNNVSINATGHTLSFVTDGHTGILRILEKTGFRDLEHIRLQFTKQGDMAQKNYLAERFKHFENKCARQQQQWHDQTCTMSKTISSLEDQLHICQVERDDIRQRMTLEASESTALRASDASQRQQLHASELERIRTENDQERSKWENKHERIVRELKSELDVCKAKCHDHESECRKLSESKEELERKVSSLSKRNDILLTEAADFEKRDRLAVAFKADATRFQTNATLEEAKTAERLKHLQDSVKSRDDELMCVRRQLEQQGAYGTTLKEQLDTARKQSDSHEASLAKAHHIISNQLQSIRANKERLAATQKELSQANELARERQMTLEREKNDRQNAVERLEMQQQRCAALQDQLAQAEEQRADLIGKLKQNEEALLHMGKVNHGDFRTFPRTAFQHTPSTIYSSLARGLHSASDTVTGVRQTDKAVNVPPPRPEPEMTSLPPSAPHISSEDAAKVITRSFNENQRHAGASSAYFPKKSI